MKLIISLTLLLSIHFTAFGQSLLSSIPANNSAGVDVNSDIILTFDQALAADANVGDSETPLGLLAFGPQDSMTFEEPPIFFSEDKRTITILVDHTANTEYNWVITGVKFASGDSLSLPIVLRYTTASEFSGVTISGKLSAPKDKGNDTSNVVVALLNKNPFMDDMEEEPFPVAATLSDQDGNFSISNVKNGVYWPVAVIDRNGDGDLSTGEAMGVWDADKNQRPDSIVVQGADVNDIHMFMMNVNFDRQFPEFITARQLFDAVQDSAIATATDNKLVFVGMFTWDDTLRTDGFAPGWYYEYYDSTSNQYFGFEAIDGKVRHVNYDEPTTQKMVNAHYAVHDHGVQEDEYMPLFIPDGWLDSDLVADTAWANGAQEAFNQISDPRITLWLNAAHYFPQFDEPIAAWAYNVEANYRDDGNNQPNEEWKSFFVDALSGEFIGTNDFNPNPNPFFSIVGSSISNYDTSVPLEDTLVINFSEKLMWYSEEDFPDVDIISPDPEIEPITINEVYLSDGDSTLNIVVTLEASTDYALIIEDAFSVNYNFLDKPFIANFTTADNYGSRKVSGNVNLDFGVYESEVKKALQKSPRFNEHEPYFNFSPIVGLIDRYPFGALGDSARFVMATDAANDSLGFKMEGVRNGTYYPIAIMPQFGFEEDFPLIFAYDENGDGIPDPITVGEEDLEGIQLTMIDILAVLSSPAREYLDAAIVMATDTVEDASLKYVFSPSFGANETGRSLSWIYVFYSEANETFSAVYAEPFGDLYFENEVYFDFENAFEFLDIFGGGGDEYDDEPYRPEPNMKIPKGFEKKDIEEAITQIQKVRLNDNSFKVAPPSLNLDFVDSDVVIASALDNGGSDFIDSTYVILTNMIAGYSLEYPLKTDGVWRVSYFSFGNGSIFDISYFDAYVDATTGEFLGAEQGYLFELGGMEVVSSNIENYTANVDENTSISVRFNQPIAQMDWDEELPVLVISPRNQEMAQLNDWYLSQQDSTINFDVTLANDADYALVIHFAVGTEGGVMISPYTLNFSTYDSYGSAAISGKVAVPEFIPGMPPNNPPPMGPEEPNPNGPMNPNSAKRFGTPAEFNMVDFKGGILVGLMDEFPDDDEEPNILYATTSFDDTLGFNIENVRPGEYFPFAFATSFDFGDAEGPEFFFTYMENGRPAKITVGEESIEGLNLSMFVPWDENGPGHSADIGRENARNVMRGRRANMRLQFMASVANVDSMGNAPGWAYVFSETDFDSLGIVVQTPNGDSLFYEHWDNAPLPKSDKFLPDTMLSSNQAMMIAHQNGGREYWNTYPDAYVEMWAGDLPFKIQGQPGKALAWLSIFYPDEETADAANSDEEESMASKLARITEDDEVLVVVVDIKTGEIVTSGTNTSNELDEVLPDKVALDQNYPNPFNPTTSIRFSLPVASDVSLQVYDLLGRNVANLASGLMTAGNHTVSFDASTLSSGMYLYRLQAGNTVITKKMMLMK